MTLVGIMQLDGKNATEKGFELGAFAKGELRGSGQALYIEALGAHLFFVTVYANRAGELLKFYKRPAAASVGQVLKNNGY